MPSPSAILAEDETVLRDELRQHLHELWPALRIVGEAATGVEALDLIERHTPDILFLDIEMPRRSGLDVAQQVQGRCHIAFVTAYDMHAVAAFDAGAVDYILKPLERSRLRLVIDVESVGRFQQDLALPFDPVALQPVDDRLEANGLFEEVLNSGFYGVILHTLQRSGGFVVAYDWRLDNVTTAKRLDALIEQLLRDYADPTRVHRASLSESVLQQKTCRSRLRSQAQRA